MRKWRARWEEDPRVESLKDRPRSGRPRTISAEREVIKLACDEPNKLLVPFRDTWTQGALVEALRLETGTTASSVQRILSAGVAIATVDPAYVAQVRQQLPCLRHRRLDG